jgi:hypothetical protein
MLFSGVPAFGGQEAALPFVVEGVVRNLDFFARPWVLWRYENYFLYDVNRLGNERIGVSLISPSGYEVKLVYDVSTLDVLYSDISLHEKSKREAMRHESISVADAIKLARSVVEY